MSRARAAWIAAALLALPAAARAASEFIVEAQLLPARVYVGAEATLRLRLLRAPGAPTGVLLLPELGDAADLAPFGSVRLYKTERDGVRYQALERTFSIVPRRAGRLVVPGAEFEGAPKFVDVPGQEDGRAPRAAVGPELALEVRPIPPGAARPWLPASSLTLEETWSPDPGEALAAGRPVTRTLVLSAEGLSGKRLPRLEMPSYPSLLVHYDRPELSTRYHAEGVAGRSVQRIVLIPVAAGEVALPPLRVGWWNVVTDEPRTTTLAGRSFSVRASPLADAPPATSPPLPARVVLKWFAVAILLLSAAFLAWHLRRQRVRDARAALREACRRNDPRAARDALVEWWKLARRHEPVPLPYRMGAAWDGRAREALAALDAALYSKRPWDGGAFWRGVRAWLRRRPSPRAPRPAPLPPLFRLQARTGRARFASHDHGLPRESAF